jgi:hypothetical protein
MTVIEYCGELWGLWNFNNLTARADIFSCLLIKSLNFIAIIYIRDDGRHDNFDFEKRKAFVTSAGKF